jgi:predicted transcriptional regulator
LKEITLDSVEVQTEPINKINLISETDLNRISSPVLARLIEEVRNEEVYSINAYNRTHNRHNRSR